MPGTIAPADYTFNKLLDILGREIEPILKDLEVYATGTPPAGYTLETEVEGIRRVADERELESLHLVGHSIGGAAALAFAAEYPERVRSLALIEPGSIARIDSTDEEAAETERILALPPEERLHEYSQLLLGAGAERPQGQLLEKPPPWMAKRPAGIEATTRALRAYKLDWEQFRNFHKPVYLARGSLSHPRWERQMNRLSALFPNIRVEVYEGRSHIDSPHRAEPERFANALRALWAIQSR
ncbi:MAG: alpha/beta fold hydrolase [Chloroflexia bacterium]